MLRIHSRFTSISGLAALTLVVVALGLTTAIVYRITDGAAGLLDAFRPSVTSRVVLTGTIDRLRAEGKMVVLTADVTAVSESETTKRIFFDLIDAGTTIVRVRAPARVQYVVPLEEITEDAFNYDDERRRLLVIVPNPRLDTAIVEVSTDPAEIDVDRDVGWLRLDAFSGRFNEQRARRLLREAAIEAGRSGRWLSEARDSARTRLMELLEPLVASLRDDVDVVVVFHDGPLPSDGGDALPAPR